MDPAVVAAFYQGKGYDVKEGVRVAGLSGNEHRVPLLAQGPLGSLAIFFGDFGGVDGPEMGGARKVARDLGATPVLAADSFSNQDRQVAARLGVVLLDGSLIQGDEEPPAPPTSTWPGLQGRAAMPTPVGRRPKEGEADVHPWPASGRVGGRDGPAARAVDIDDLLADTRRGPPAPETDEGEDEEATGGAPVPVADDAAHAAPTAADGLWKRPRAASAAAPAPARPSGARFAWLGLGAATGSDKAGGTAFTVDYDDVVPARPGDPASGAGPVLDQERLGDDVPELKATMDAEDRRRRKDRLQRRVFWALFAFVFLYLFWLFWDNKLFN